MARWMIGDWLMGNVFNGVYTEPIAVEGGIYLVKVGTDTFKVAL